MFMLTLEIILGALVVSFLVLVIYASMWLYALLRVSKALQKETNSLILDAHELRAGLKNQQGIGAKAGLVGRSIKKAFLRWLIS